MTESKPSEGFLEYDKYNTSALPPLGIDEDIPSPSIQDIKNSETAYLILLNYIKSRDHYYQEAKKEAEYYRTKSEDRRIAVVFSTVGEFLLALGTGSLFAGYNMIVVPILLLAGGLAFSALSLYFNFRMKQK